MFGKKIVVALWAFSGACLAQQSSPAASPTKKDFEGRWMVTEVVGYATEGGGIPHAKELLGKLMEITTHGIDFDGNRCTAYKGFRLREVDSAVELRANAGATREDAELPGKVFLLDSDNCTAIFWLRENKIEFDDMGVFVRAYRTR
ncbi:hypothetical protein ASG87_00165 [Frateuria sp. Soil773]|uniref:hypothetical protein n=1 Tax=Frateuria sp. Soil773 TaxID=1736407 RepID=UPI0006F49195|nr:hypothetical protein [Frateuria sp. Soil773]KRE97022.1 hypothetical protein ASG87_00165 [Frateuria sp. Soil773]